MHPQGDTNRRNSRLPDWTQRYNLTPPKPLFGVPMKPPREQVIFNKDYSEGGMGKGTNYTYPTNSTDYYKKFSNNAVASEINNINSAQKISSVRKYNKPESTAQTTSGEQKPINNVFNPRNFSPKQLAEQRKKMLESMRKKLDERKDGLQERLMNRIGLPFNNSGRELLAAERILRKHGILDEHPEIAEIIHKKHLEAVSAATKIVDEKIVQENTADVNDDEVDKLIEDEGKIKTSNQEPANEITEENKVVKPVIDQQIQIGEKVTEEKQEIIEENAVEQSSDEQPVENQIPVEQPPVDQQIEDQDKSEQEILTPDITTEQTVAEEKISEPSTEDKISEEDKIDETEIKEENSDEIIKQVIETGEEDIEPSTDEKVSEEEKPVEQEIVDQSTAEPQIPVEPEKENQTPDETEISEKQLEKQE